MIDPFKISYKFHVLFSKYENKNSDSKVDIILQIDVDKLRSYFHKNVAFEY